MLKDHANRPFTDFRGIRLLVFHNPILSSVGVSSIPGEIQQLYMATVVSLKHNPGIYTKLTIPQSE